MLNTITIKEAINKGNRMMVVTPLLIFLACMLSGALLAANLYVESWFVAAAMGVGFILAVWRWCYASIQWKIWAFENIRNVHALKRKAIRRKLLLEEGHFFEKFQIINVEQREKWKRIQKKFLVEDEYHDDISVGRQTEIFYSKASSYVGLSAAALFIGMGIYMLVEGKEGILALVFVFGFAAFITFKTIQRLTNKTPQIAIDAAGIRLKDGILIPWENIRNEEIIMKMQGKHMQHFLTFQHDGKTEQVAIGELDSNFDKLENLLEVYRLRHKKQASLK